MRLNAQAHLPTQETPPSAPPRIPQAHGHGDRTPGTPTTSSEGPGPSHRLTTAKARDRRLRRRADFDRVFRSGRHNSSQLMAVRSLANEAGITRVAVSPSKRIGNAVVRNRVRRRLKEAFRCLAVIEGFDVVIVPRAAAAEAGFSSLKDELTLLLQRARLLASEG